MEPLDRAWMLAADQLPTMVYTVGPDGEAEFCNAAYFRFTGVDPDDPDWIDKAWDCVHREDRAGTFEAFTRSLQTGADFTYEHRLQTMDGTFCWVLVSAKALRDIGGRVVRWYGTITDIDQRKRLEQRLLQQQAELSDSRQRFEVLAEAIPVIVWSADRSGAIDWYNHGWFDYTGQTPQEAAGWGWQAVHHPDDLAEVMLRWPDSIATGKPFEMEFRLKGRDGEFRWFLTRVLPQTDDAGAVVRWYGSNIDIHSQKTALQRSQQVLQSLQSVFLPQHLPVVPGMQFDAAYLPSERDALVGGDWYDVARLPHNAIVFSIGDVAGHGLEASALSGRLRQTIYALSVSTRDPALVLEAVNDVLLLQ